MKFGVSTVAAVPAAVLVLLAAPPPAAGQSGPGPSRWALTVEELTSWRDGLPAAVDELCGLGVAVEGRGKHQCPAVFLSGPPRSGWTGPDVAAVVGAAVAAAVLVWEWRGRRIAASTDGRTRAGVTIGW